MATMTRRILWVLAGATLAFAAWLPMTAHAQQAGRPPSFQIDTNWGAIPNNWAIGDVTSIAVDPDDHIWVLHRLGSIPADKKAQAAPPVLEFDQSGKLLNSWGGPAAGLDWPEREHGIFVDKKGFVWVSGNAGWPRPAAGGSSDDVILKFTQQGKLVMQIGKRGQSKGNADTENVHQPADVFVHAPTNELFVADGYGNRRIIVFDADSGKFKRMWGAYGNKPEDAPPAPARGAAPGGAPGGAPAGGRGVDAGARAGAPDAGARGAAPAGGRGAAPAGGRAGGGANPESQQFGLPHAVKVSNDGLVYVGDRSNRRIQIFSLDGKFVRQFVVEGEASPTPAGFAFSPDAKQQFLYVIDSANARMLVFDRAAMTIVDTWGSRGPQPGQLDTAHHIAADSKGNLYTAEIVANHRAQRFIAQPR